MWAIFILINLISQTNKLILVHTPLSSIAAKQMSLAVICPHSDIHHGVPAQPPNSAVYCLQYLFTLVHAQDLTVAHIVDCHHITTASNCTLALQVIPL